MSMHYWIRRIAGTMVLASLALGYWISPWFFVVTAFVGLNLLQSSFTRFCPMERVLRAFGVPPADDGLSPRRPAPGVRPDA